MNYGVTIPMVRRLVCCVVVVLVAAVSAAGSAMAAVQDSPRTRAEGEPSRTSVDRTVLERKMTCAAGPTDKVTLKITQKTVEFKILACVCADTPERARGYMKEQIELYEQLVMSSNPDPHELEMYLILEHETVLAPPPGGEPQEETLFCYPRKLIQQLAQNRNF